MQQAKGYAEMLGVPFAYSSNGDAFQEYDFLTGREREISLDAFPSPDELWQRWLREGHVSEKEGQLIQQPYYTAKKEPRYYQQRAVDLTLKSFIRGQKRMLIVMATGTGKTYTAFQIVYCLKQQGAIRKILYLADRTVLIDQTISRKNK